VGDLAVSSDDRLAFVTGTSWRYKHSHDWVTIAMSTKTGKKVWVRTEDLARRWDSPSRILVDPDGRTIYVAGSFDRARGTLHGWIAYDVDSGRRLWRDLTGFDVIDTQFVGSSLYLVESRDCDSSRCGDKPQTRISKAKPTRTGLNRRWVHEVPDHKGNVLFTSIAANDRLLFLGGSRTSGKAVFIRAFAKKDGSKKWAIHRDVSTSDQYLYLPAFTADRYRGALYVGVSIFREPDRILAFDAGDGHVLWATDYSPTTSDNDDIDDFVVGRHRLYAGGAVIDEQNSHGATTVVALSPSTGRRRWIARYDAADPNDPLRGYLRFKNGLLRVLGADSSDHAGLLTYEK
jgi:outer membrane protein assembly factor BamB